MQRAKPSSRFVSAHPWNRGAAITCVSPSSERDSLEQGGDADDRRRIVAPSRTLRSPRRAGREDDHPPLGAPWLDPFRRPGQLVQGGLVERSRTTRRDEVGELVVVDDEPDVFLLDHVSQLRAGEPGVEQDDVCPRRGDGDEGFDEPAMIATEQADAGRRRRRLGWRGRRRSAGHGSTARDRWCSRRRRGRPPDPDTAPPRLQRRRRASSPTASSRASPSATGPVARTA